MSPGVGGVVGVVVVGVGDGDAVVGVGVGVGGSVVGVAVGEVVGVGEAVVGDGVGVGDAVVGVGVGDAVVGVGVGDAVVGDGSGVAVVGSGSGAVASVTWNTADCSVRDVSPVFSEPVSSLSVCPPRGSAGSEPLAPAVVPSGSCSSSEKVPSAAASTMAQMVLLRCSAVSSRL